MRRSPTNILVVDADPDIREALSDMLRHEGYRVKAVGIGAEALQRVRQEHYGAVLLDIQLPDFDGLSILRVMKESNPSLPVIVLTGYATVENTIETLVKSAFAYLTKPYKQEEIKAIIARALGVNRPDVRAKQIERAFSH